MAPKKKPVQRHHHPKKPASTSANTKSQSSTTSGPRLQISAENENRLRRLLLNADRSNQPAPVQDNLSKAQKAKKLNTIYEELSCDGFSNDQIELALSSLKDNATLECALDWLCLNLPANELPLKFSHGTSLHSSEGSVNILSTGKDHHGPLKDHHGPSKDHHGPSKDQVVEIDEDAQPVSIRVKGQQHKDYLDSSEPLQADWIRQYLLQQEEEESRSWEDDADVESSIDKVSRSRPYDVITREYYAARLEAAKAKQKGDKKRQDQAGQVIRQLKQELSLLGDTLAQHMEDEYAAGYVFDGSSKGTVVSEDVQANFCEEAVAPVIGDDKNCASPLEVPAEPSPSIVHPYKPSEDELGDVALGEFFLEDGASIETLPSEILELQKKEKLRALYGEKNLEKLDGIWKKGDARKVPKALLQQLCQKSGWEAPKYNRKDGGGKSFSYTVTILRKATGRGKSRKAGGLIAIQLPVESEKTEYAEEAQNRVATFALHQLFPDLPIHLVVTEPYGSLAWQWKEGESSIKLEEHVKERRAGFVEQLLNKNFHGSNVAPDFGYSFTKNVGVSHVEESFIPQNAPTDAIVGRQSHAKDKESSFLRDQEENKMKMPKYKEMLEVRATLPITGLKNDILQALKENDVIVVCGETGSGKTTQVPQFILDDMIMSGCGGHCNIICTQPRRIAAISVAQRVAEERCEPSPGSYASLVGYQVRLESARSEKTKLLFCTTGILLRKLAAEKNLDGVTHVIVDEVHERSLLGDFLLIILKNIIEKQSGPGMPKLKVIIMSATVDSNLFSSYFGHCPVLTAQGRAHPVTTYFLEDIYDSIGYHLASDSPAAFGYETLTMDKDEPVNNHRGKKNLVLSAWGDDTLLAEECINPLYVSRYYETYSEQTQKNLKRLNEDVIDYDLLEDLVCHVDDTCGEGSILIFLPGISEINLLADRLAASYRFGGQSSEWILPLHSSLTSADQKRVFSRPPGGIRKIIIATNIAETSITIDDVVYVIDSGKHKENRYDPRKKLTRMVEDWISQANARQRRGRAGRVKPGICFCLYTRHRFEKLMHPYQVPEMLRMSLVELCLQIKLLSLGYIKPFLSKALESPREEAMTSAISMLYEVGAIQGDEELTALGNLLAKLPVDALIGKMMLYGAIFGCLSPILSISAILSYKSPFVYPKDERHNVDRARFALVSDVMDSSHDPGYSGGQSDHLIMMMAYQKWGNILHEKGAKAALQFCNSYYLSSSVMYTIRDMRVQLGMLLADIGLINVPDYQIVGKRTQNLDLWLSERTQPFNMYSHHSAIVKAIICAGLYPNVAASEEGMTAASLNRLKKSSRLEAKGHLVWYDGRREVHIHPSSINSSAKAFRFPFLVFLEKVETNKVFLRDTSVISPFSILLFGGPISLQHQTGLVSVDGWLKFVAPAQMAVLFKELRMTLHTLLMELIQNPEKAKHVDNEVVKSVIHLLLDEDRNDKK